MGQSIDTFKKRDRRDSSFLTDHNFHLSDRLHDEEFLTRLAWLGDVFSHLNDQNLGLYSMCETTLRL